MLSYSVFMFVLAAVFILLAVLIYRGNTRLIHDYHQTRVRPEDKAAYGRSFSRGIFGVAASMLLSGIIALFGESSPVALAAVAVLLVGMVISFVILLRAQKKFNRGLF